MSKDNDKSPETILPGLSLMPELAEDTMTYVPCAYCKGIMGGCEVCRRQGKPGFMELGLTVDTVQGLIQQNKEVWALNETLQDDLAEIAGLLGEYMEKTPEDLQKLIEGKRLIPVMLAIELHKSKFPEQYDGLATSEPS